MNNITNVGRWIGASMLLSFAIGLYSNFKLQTDLFAGEGLLVNAAQHPYRIGLIALIGLSTSLLTLWAATLVSTHFRHRHPAITRYYFGLVVAALAISLIECSTLVAFRSLSEAYTAAGPQASELFLPARKLLTGLRNSIHFMDVLVGGTSVLVLFAFLFRARLVPRALAAVGIAAAAIQMYSVSRPLFGLPVVYPLLLPLALAYFTLLCWLLVKGFAEDANA
ncbi:DUF4386 family protein [Lysobacter sp. cf310]|uniref:DUF4386 family protein n=1 Tax=Lysobacter sp. cf310 TaxID=1761790 RepID=UPI0008EB01A7|nr:DUF4386 family protein [Lysobacter sp. cf310]SFK93488.1 protein of unknown function [Lysobacter sp. cf310]